MILNLRFIFARKTKATFKFSAKFLARFHFSSPHKHISIPIVNETLAWFYRRSELNPLRIVKTLFYPEQAGFCLLGSVTSDQSHTQSQAKAENFSFLPIFEMFEKKRVD